MLESGKTKMTKVTKEALTTHFPSSRPLRIAMETGTHSNWVGLFLHALCGGTASAAWPHPFPFIGPDKTPAGPMYLTGLGIKVASPALR
jgi:hypothetical protein